MARGWGTATASVALGLLMSMSVACRAGVGERCICADDCKSGLVCVSSGRELRADECIPAASDSEPCECVEDANAGDGDGDAADGPPLYMDLGSKRDFSPPAPLEGSSGGSETAAAGTSSSTGTASTSTSTGPESTSTGSTSTSSASSGSTSSGSASSGSSSSGGASTGSSSSSGAGATAG